MSGPDGLEQRTADDAEYYEREYDAIERIEEREREDGEDRIFDEHILDIAQARMTSFFIDKIIGG